MQYTSGCGVANRINCDTEQGGGLTGPEVFDHIYLHREFVDFRKSVNGLTIIVEEEMNLDPFSKYLFVFCNKRRDKMKALYWDNSGFALWYKGLEEEKFAWPKKITDDVVTINPSQLKMLLEGYNIWKLRSHRELKYNKSF